LLPLGGGVTGAGLLLLLPPHAASCAASNNVHAAPMCLRHGLEENGFIK
jgi:hypothetical protein